MSPTTWTPRAVSAEALAWQGQAWRMVESQHIAATMKLVDNRDEQDLLESLLESSKPSPPGDTRGLHYLLATPFRYVPRLGGSRFRAYTDPGVFYAAASVRTAGAELGYWRWKFLQEAVDLDRVEPVAHTAFRVDIATQVIDLRKPPFDSQAARWQHPTNYGPTHRLAQAVREARVGGIVYWSVRDPQPSWCVALLTPAGFARRKPHAETQTWYLAVSREGVTLRRDNESMEFPAKGVSWGRRLLVSPGATSTDAPPHCPHPKSRS